jgi:hypothetical protein
VFTLEACLVSSPRSPAPLTGWLYEATLRGRQGDDYGMSGHVRIGGIDYQVRLYGPFSVQGTSRRRWALKLSPDGADGSRGTP